jgi:hypothetical protein
VGKHLLDETAEFRLPQLGRHAATDEDELETTNRFAAGARRQPPVPARQQDPDER